MGRRPIQFLYLATLGVLLLSVILGFVGKRIVNAGLLPPAAIISGLSPVRDFLVVRSGVDSWAPMLAALHQIEEHPETSLYQAVFFDRHQKFQYPLSSLLPLWIAQRIGLNDDGILWVLRIGSWLAVCSMAVISAIIGVVLLRAYSVSKPPGLIDRVTAVIGVLVASVLFYPFMRGY